MNARPGFLLLLAASCTAPAVSEDVPDPAPEPATEDRPEVAWTLELSRSPSLEVHFRLRAPSDPDGRTTFLLDESWGGVADASDAILDVAVSGPDGRPLAVERDAPNRWSVAAPPGTDLEAAWRVVPNGFQADPNPRVHYRTLLDEDLFHAIGHLSLLVPDHLQGSARRRIALRWKGFAEAGWNVASSLGPSPAGFVGEASLDEVRHAVYLAGPDLRVPEVEVRGRPVQVAIAGTAWTFKDEEFVEAVRAIVEAERAFFEDFDFPFYLVSLIPVGRPDPQSRSLGGTGLTRSFALFMQPDTALGKEAGGGLSVPHLLAHEMFHHWNGGVASLESPEELLYWFSEGFTDFYARRLLHRAGFGGIDEVARSLNECLKSYALSPVREAPASRIREDFWKDPDVGRLPYLRGDLVAALLDGEIRRASGGARSLDDFVREVVAAGRAGALVGTESILARIASWTSPDVAARVRSIVVDGAPIVLDEETFAPCLEIASASLGAYELGFDLEASRAAKEIRSVLPGSAAERAGLQDGQKLARLRVAFGDPDQEVEIGVRDGEEEKTLRWLPQGPPVPVQRVRAVGADCAWL